MIAINEKEKLLSAYTKQLEPSNPLLDEAKVALCVVKRVVLEGFNNIVIEGDDWNAIDLLRSPNVIPY